MPELFPSAPLLGAFVVASLALALTPGPVVFYILTHSVMQGRRAGLASALGVASGGLCNAVAASLGLAALFAFSPLAFTVVKYVGAAYLVVLGIRAFRNRGAEVQALAEVTPRALRRVYRDAFAVALLNPGTTLFFAVFLPQFLTVHNGSVPVVSVLALGGLFVLIAAATHMVYVLAAGSVHPWFIRHGGLGRGGRLLEGGVYIALGLFAALSRQH